MRTSSIVLIAALAMTVVFAQEKRGTISKEQAQKTALAHVPHGVVRSAELEKEAGKEIWSFDIAVGKEIKEVWVDAHTGAYIKTEEESAEKEKAEESKERSEKATREKAHAEKVALAKVPGTVVKSGREKEHGKYIYEVTIKDSTNQLFEVIVDAKTMKVLEVEKPESEKKEQEQEKEKR